MAGYPSPVLITGAGSELAQGLRARLEARGVSCFMACRSEKSLLACRGKGQAAALLTHPEDLPKLCREALGSGPEGLADFQHSPFESLLAQASPSAIEEWAAGDIALRARVLRALSRSMLARRRGRCLFISSAAADRPAPGQGFYAAAKLAGEALYRSLGLELGRRGVTACSLRLSWIDTGRGHRFLEGRADKASERMPTGRLVTADEAFDAMLFLLKTPSFNATTAVLDGGLSAAKIPL